MSTIRVAMLHFRIFSVTAVRYGNQVPQGLQRFLACYDLLRLQENKELRIKYNWKNLISKLKSVYPLLPCLRKAEIS